MVYLPYWSKITVHIFDCQLGKSVGKFYGNTVHQFPKILYFAVYQAIPIDNWRA
jgi:hypothetical protein